MNPSSNNLLHDIRSTLNSWKFNFGSVLHMQAVRGAHKQVFVASNDNDKKSYLIKEMPCSRQVSLVAASDM